ncbi:NmrA family NAD(P)-binding protein [Kineococcus indalonis]|uniref:NmrA family NAD(P)-binding protein n=1 Tax=Kineococcus indalonis TaxID=2696566 RepID=UPI0014133D6C|nr:NAD(P)H-binding protein [Kineococcus indalonis]NAZ87348.1 NAD(P)H-binding protein [Kineococcus indalonis]
MIVITGATGALNGATVEHLLQHVPAARVAVVVRDVSRAGRFAERGVQVRHGDYADPASLPAAFADAEQLLLVSADAPAEEAVALHRTAVEAAVAAGVGRVLYTSHQGAAPGNPFAPGRTHAATERLLADSGTPWTALRNGFYAHALPWFTGPWRETGVVAVPADGPVSWTAREDAAEAAAAVLASGGAHDGPITLTAGAAPTFEEVARTASELTGRHVERVLVDPEGWVAAQVAAGQEESRARFALGVFQGAEQGFFAGTDPLLATLLGRAPRTVREVLAAPAPAPVAG